MASLGAALYGSLTVHPYSISSPKRVTVNHVHMTEESPGPVSHAEASLAVASLHERLLDPTKAASPETTPRIHRRPPGEAERAAASCLPADGHPAMRVASSRLVSTG